MNPIIALAGLGGLSSADELLFDLFILLIGTLRASALPIFTFDHPPVWMVYAQPVIVAIAIFLVSRKLSRYRMSFVKKAALYIVTYGVTMFATNMAGEARGLFFVARDVIKHTILIKDGKSYPADTRP